MKTKNVCSLYDYALTESARMALRAPNKFICTCIHCRAQAVTKETIAHSKDCCFATQTHREHKLVKAEV